MLTFFFVICFLQLIGEAIVYMTGVPIPGPVIGMILLLISLIIKKGVPESFDTAANGLLRYLALLFVPAGVGVTLHFHLIAEEWLAITASVILATLLTIVFSALIMKSMVKSDG